MNASRARHRKTAQRIGDRLETLSKGPGVWLRKQREAGGDRASEEAHQEVSTDHGGKAGTHKGRKRATFPDEGGPNPNADVAQG